MAKRKPAKRTVKSCIRGTGGIITAIVEKVNKNHKAKKMAGTTWGTIDKMIKEDEDLSKAYKDEQESILDLAESKLVKDIQDGDQKAYTFMLERKAKDRGYGNQQKIEHSGKIEKEDPYKDFTDDELEVELKKLKKQKR